MGWEFSCPTLMVLMRLVSCLVWANEIVGSSGAVIPAAASASVSRREMPFSSVCNRPESGASGAVRSRFIVSLRVRFGRRPIPALTGVRPRYTSVDIHGAPAAQCHAAAVFRTGQPQHVTQHPEERRAAVDIDRVRVSIDLDEE